MHILIWTLALMALVPWTLAAWGLATLLGLDPAWVADLKPLLARIPFGGVLETWVPNWHALALSALDAARTVLSWLGHVAPWVVWVVWAGGAFLVVGCAAFLSAVVHWARKAQASPPAASPSAA